MKDRFNLRDKAFVGDPCSVRGKQSKYIEWDRTCSTPNAPTFYTHEQMFRDDIVEDAYGWLIESKAILPHVYKEVPHHLDKFKTVFTHDAELLSRWPEKCEFAPGGGVWLGGTVGKGSIGIHPKTKNISLVSSDKLMCPLHAYRYRLAHRLKNSGLVDVYGTATGQWVDVCETVEPYRFSIVVENDIAPFWFTEKILNCFAAGTIPIYVGATQIGEFFNADGIICVSDYTDILDILKYVATPDYYNHWRRQEAIQQNFEYIHMYGVIEDHIWETMKGTFNS